jgi:hypothetical protein
MHRFAWDLRYSLPPLASPQYSMATVFGRNVPVEPGGAQALPGSYQVRLTVDGKSYTQPFTLVMDPRVPASSQELEKQFALATRLTQGLQQANQSAHEIHEARAAGHISEEIERRLAGAGRRGGGEEEESEPGGEPHVSLAQVSSTLAQLLGVTDSADAAPTSQVSQAADKALAQLQSVLAEWQKLKH